MMELEAMDVQDLFAGELFSPLQEDTLDVDLGVFQDDLLGLLGSTELPFEDPLGLEQKQPSPVPSQPTSSLLAVQRCSGPPTKRKATGPVRLVTTELPSPSPAAPAPASSSGTSPLVKDPVVPKSAAVPPLPTAGFSLPVRRAATGSRVLKQTAAPVSPAHSHMKVDEEDSDDTDSEDSNDTEEKGLTEPGARANKRKAPEIDWRSIEDLAERRRQRRLAKNRITAARSRERKKTQWAEMESKLHALEKDNQMLKAMMENLARENSSLRSQLGLAPAAAMAPSQGGKRSKADPAAVALVIATLLLLASTLPADGATLLLVSGVPLALLAALLSAKAKDGKVLPEVLMATWASIQALLQATMSKKKVKGKSSSSSVHIKMEDEEHEHLSAKSFLGDAGTLPVRLSGSQILRAAGSLAGVTGMVVA